MSSKRRIDWDPHLVMQLLLTRSDGWCEGRTVACLARYTRLRESRVLSRNEVSIQHRLARKKGGTLRPEVHELPSLLVLCGTGTTGCHGWVEGRRPGMEQRGLWVREGVTPAAEVPVILASGRIASLVHGYFYEYVGDHWGPIPGEVSTSLIT